jgi:tetratricopeptide (TPR) repeat protein
MIMRLSTITAICVFLISPASPLLAEVDIAEWNAKNFTPALASVPGGRKDIQADMYHRKARGLLKAYQKDGALDKLYTSLNAEGEAIALAPEKAAYWSSLGDIHAEMAKLDLPGAESNVIESYKQALALDPGDAATMVLLGVALARTSEYKAALDYFEKAVEKAPYLMSYDLVQWMNLCYLAGGQTRRGTLFYDRFLQANPEFYPLRVYAAILYDAHFDYSNASKELFEVIGDKRIDAGTKQFAKNLIKEIQKKETGNR